MYSVPSHTPSEHSSPAADSQPSAEAAVSAFVVDKKMLGLMAVKLGAAGSAAFTAILAYSAYAVNTSSVETGSAQCHLSATQVAMVQSVLQERNASCVYNMTIDAVLGM